MAIKYIKNSTFIHTKISALAVAVIILDLNLALSKCLQSRYAVIFCLVLNSILNSVTVQ